MTEQEKVRLSTYIRMRDFIRHERECGFCYALFSQSNVFYDVEELPELMKYSPPNWWINTGIYLPFYKRRKGFWFQLGEKGKKKRLKILDKIIKKMERA